MKKLWILLSLILFAGCSVIGHPPQRLIDEGFSGPPEIVWVGVYRDRSVSEDTVVDIMKSIKYEFKQYGLSVELSWLRPWDRKSLTMDGIILDIAQLPLERDCDKIFVIVGREASDYIWGALMLPEVFGGVETATRTRGYVVGEIGSLNQLFSGGPKNCAIHEFYHLFGCDDFQSGTGCYDRIAMVRKEAQRNRQLRNIDFFPTIAQNETILLLTREQVNARIKAAIEYEKAKTGKKAEL
jgi:hypothetical protein